MVVICGLGHMHSEEAISTRRLWLHQSFSHCSKMYSVSYNLGITGSSHYVREFNKTRHYEYLHFITI
jgi:hypothetical protein